MKVLKVSANGFKNCADDFSIDMIAKSKKTSEDKEYELLEIAEDLYVYTTIGIVGKNASGKTSALELLDWCYDILSTFRLDGKKCDYHGISLNIYFFEDGFIYKYYTELDNASTREDRAIFKNQQLFRKKYYKTKIKNIFDADWTEQIDTEDVPEDFSVVYSILKKSIVREIFYEASTESENGYGLTFWMMHLVGLEAKYLDMVLNIFDSKIESLKQIDEHNYLICYQGQEKNLSGKELYRFLSSGTTKGINLYILAVISLKYGFDLLVDEIENHFHKTLVENLIMLYKDKKVNKKNATLIFTTHYCELLDLFNRSDNIWVTHARDKIEIENMYEKYDFRTELLKSRKFYQNVFDTAVNYDTLMKLKQELMT